MLSLPSWIHQAPRGARTFKDPLSEMGIMSSSKQAMSCSKNSLLVCFIQECIHWTTQVHWHHQQNLPVSHPLCRIPKGIFIRTLHSAKTLDFQTSKQENCSPTVQYTASKKQDSCRYTTRNVCNLTAYSCYQDKIVKT